MKSTVLLALVLVFGADACATAPAALPTCDGKHRRPANPNGSVLAPSSTPSTATPPAPQPTPSAEGCGR